MRWLRKIWFKFYICPCGNWSMPGVGYETQEGIQCGRCLHLLVTWEDYDRLVG